MTNRIPLIAATLISLGVAGCGGERPAETVSAPSLEVTFDTVAVLGAMDGAPWETFGTIAAAEVSERGWLAVLDLQVNSVFVFDLDGNYIGAVDRAGQGPGEIGQAWAIASDTAGDLLVMDTGNARISRYSITDQGLAFVGLQRTALRSRSLCVVGGRMFVGDARDGHVIHEVGADGALIRSFAPHPPLGNEPHLSGFEDLVIPQRMLGRLLCSEEEGGKLLHVSSSDPGVRLHDLSGERLWSTKIAGVYPFEAAVEGATFTARYNEATGAHFARSLLRWDSEHALVQHGVRYPTPRPDDQDFHALESRLLRLDTGAEVAKTTDLPWFLASEGDHYIHIRHAPYAQVFILRRR